MTAQLVKPQAKCLAAHEGETFQMLTHTVVRKVGREDTNGLYAMFEAIDTAGNGAPLHTHPWEESFYVLEGEIEMYVGEDKVIATPGSTVHVPANTLHGFKIVSAIARTLVIISPGSAEAFYEEMGAKLTSLPPDPQVFAGICSRHGVVI